MRPVVVIALAWATPPLLVAAAAVLLHAAAAVLLHAGAAVLLHAAAAVLLRAAAAVPLRAVAAVGRAGGRVGAGGTMGAATRLLPLRHRVRRRRAFLVGRPWVGLSLPTDPPSTYRGLVACGETP